MPSNHHIFCHPFLLLPSVFPSIKVFSSDSVPRILWPKYWSSSFSISPCNEYSGLISCRLDWFDLLAVQQTLKSLLQPHNLKASVFQCSGFFKVHLSHPYMTTGKTIVLTRQTCVGKVMSLFFKMLSRFVIAFLPSSKHLLISQLQSPSTVILEPKKRVSVLRGMMHLVKDSRGSMEPPGLSPSVSRKPQGREHISEMCSKGSLCTMRVNMVCRVIFLLEIIKSTSHL